MCTLFYSAEKESMILMRLVMYQEAHKHILQSPQIFLITLHDPLTLLLLTTFKTHSIFALEQELFTVTEMCYCLVHFVQVKMNRNWSIFAFLKHVPDLTWLTGAHCFKENKIMASIQVLKKLKKESCFLFSCWKCIRLRKSNKYWTSFCWQTLGSEKVMVRSN